MGRAEDFDDGEEEMVSVHLRMPKWMQVEIDRIATQHHRTRTGELLTWIDVHIKYINPGIDDCITQEAIRQAHNPEVIDRVEKEDTDW